MQVAEAKRRVLAMMRRDLAASGAAVDLDPASPDGDPGKFRLRGRTARVILRFSGWHVPVNLLWFAGGDDPPDIQRGRFELYVFYIPAYSYFAREHYLVVDVHQMRQWVAEFNAPLGNDYQDQRTWRADLRRIPGDRDEHRAYFRWGDEPMDLQPFLSRVVRLDNVAELAVRDALVGVHELEGGGGESVAHWALKHWVAERPQILGLSANAQPSIEFGFRTGDRVDVLFDNHGPRRAAVEVEVEGEANLVTGVHQALKYRALAAAERGWDLQGPDTWAIVAAYETRYPAVADLARRYDVKLVQVDRAAVLGAA